MAEKKDNHPKSGFDAPSIGVPVPKDYVMKRLKNGRVTFVPPTEGKKKNGKK